MAKKLQPLHWFPFDTDRWLGELAGGLTAEQKGGLLDLLATSWTQVPPCSLPNDDHYLATRSGLGKRWKANRAVVLAQFSTIGERVVCGWLLEIYNEQFTKYTNRSVANRENIRNRVRTPSVNEPPTNGSTKKGTNRTTNRTTNRLQNTEQEGVVPPAPSGAGVVHPPATEGAPAPEGAALPVAKSNGDYQDRPSVREALMRRGVRPEQLNAPHETFTIQDVAARRDDQQREYDAALGEAVTAFLGAMDPDEANRLERDARVTLRLAATGALPELKAQRVRALVVDRIRKAEGWPTVADWDGSPDAFSWLPGELRVQETAS